MRKYKIKFYSGIQGIDEAMPIIPTKEYRHEWIKKARTKQTDNLKSIIRCPGINGIMTTGWLVRSWLDIKLRIEGDDFFWQTPLDQVKLSNGLCQPVVGEHDEQHIYENWENYPKNTFKKIIKINTPWWVEIPKGYYLLQFHPSYLDDNRFTSCSGKYTRDGGLAAINVPMFWHSIEDEYLIKAGTPLAQLVLVKDEDIDFKNYYDGKYLRKTLNTHTILSWSRFKRSYGVIKDYYVSKDRK